MGAYLGGYVFEMTGSYNWIWYVDMALAVSAAVIHMPIPEKRPVLAKAALAA